MNNIHPVNRVENDLHQWRSREERFSKLFSFNLSGNKALLKEKLRYYDSVASKYRNTASPDERFALRMLRQERNQIERKLYPNLLLRLLRRLIVPVRQQYILKQEIKQTTANTDALRNTLQRTGFGNVIHKLEENMAKGQAQFSIPVSQYVNEKERLDYNLSFSKDHNGTYSFDGYKAELYNGQKQDIRRQQYFGMDTDNEITASQAYNLLAGRAVLKEQYQSQGKWMQLDFNDKDMQGNFRLREFQTAYGYDLMKALQQLPLKELQEHRSTQKLLDGLKMGDRQAVSFLKDGKEQRFYIEANPQHKSINIYDEHAKKISLTAALGNKTMEAVKVSHKMGEEQVRSQGKRNGMRVM
ncbi:hypothetical protein [Chitinophaga defluvii]|uniref:DUF3945 domain-containing protein n=1 Tax=Chitinophaga defluvii TaxID=3163343 RepID=A0ABV2T6K5_9BACT